MPHSPDVSSIRRGFPGSLLAPAAATLCGQEVPVHDIEAAAVDSPSEYVADQARRYLDSDGTDVEHPFADRLILLYVRGRRSGLIRRIPLVSVRNGDDLFIVGSKGGAPEHPAWYLNLQADPEVWVRDKADFYPARADTLDGASRAAAWAQLVEAMPFFLEYDEKTERTLPVIRLSPSRPHA